MDSFGVCCLGGSVFCSFGGSDFFSGDGGGGGGGGGELSWDSFFEGSGSEAVG